MKTKLLEYIVCPACKAQLSLKVDQEKAGEIIEGLLTCQSCKMQYPVKRGIPRLLPAELSQEKKDTAEAFGYEWTHFTELTNQYELQFLDWIAPIKKDFFPGKIVLDAGCGKGRHTWLSAKFGAREVIGIDLSVAVEVAHENTRAFPNAHIIQADIYHLPFKAPFDYIYSIGVLHHLPDPKKGFLSLVEHLKSGGRISAWVYGREGNWWIENIVNPIRMTITSKLPKIITKLIAFFIAVPMQVALKCLYRPINMYLPELRNILFYNDYLFSISDFSFRENFSIVFDHLIAPTAFYIPRYEFESWFRTADLNDLQITRRNRNSWRGTGIKN